MHTNVSEELYFRLEGEREHTPLKYHNLPTRLHDITTLRVKDKKMVSDNDECLGHPSTSRTDKLVAQMRELVRNITGG